jgi:hypothetical protein
VRLETAWGSVADIHSRRRVAAYCRRPVPLVYSHTLLSRAPNLAAFHLYVPRRPKRYEVVPTPLTRLNWWRLVLDEAQMVRGCAELCRLYRGVGGSRLLGAALCARLWLFARLMHFCLPHLALLHQPCPPPLCHSYAPGRLLYS